MYFEDIGQFQLIKDSLDISIIDDAKDEDTKKLLLAYMFCENLKGIKLYVPTKTHKLEMAKKLLIDGKDIATIQKELLLDRRTISKIKKNLVNK